METKLVSVIIPTYNRADMLREAIESVLSQTYENFELLILDNCSPDHTPDVVASFNDPRIKYLRHKCNIGAGANWTYGVRLAKGEYLSILADDDRYKPDFLAHRIEVMMPDPCIVSAFGPFESWDGGSKLTGKIFYPDVGSICQSVALHGAQAMEAVLCAQFVGASLYRSSAVHATWDRVGIGQRAGDTLLNILLASGAGNKVVFIPESDMLYRVHPGQDTSMNIMLVIEDVIRVFELQMKNADDKDVRQLFKQKFIKSVNAIGRVQWDHGNINYSIRCFWEELKVSPFHFITWLRLLRCVLYKLKRKITYVQGA